MNKETSVYFALKWNDHDLLEMLLKPKLKVTKNSTYEAEYQKEFC
jgi:hypothetical protein